MYHFQYVFDWISHVVTEDPLRMSLIFTSSDQIRKVSIGILHFRIRYFRSSISNNILNIFVVFNKTIENLMPYNLILLVFDEISEL